MDTSSTPMGYVVRKRFKDGSIEENKFSDFRPAIIFYFKAEKPFWYGKNGGSIKLIKEEHIIGCN